MARLLLVGLLPALGADAQGVLAPDEAGQVRKPVMRHDASVLQMSAQGDFRSVTARRNNPTEFDSCKDYCCNSYVPGITGGSKCCNGEADCADHQPIIVPGVCSNAAQEAGAEEGLTKFNETGNYTMTKEFMVKGPGLDGIDWQAIRPKGCFEDNTLPVVGGATSAKHFYYNGVNNEPDLSNRPETSGMTPICQRPRYVNGTTDSNTCTDAQIANKYERIMDAESCQSFAECSGYCWHEDLWKVGTPQAAVRHDQFPDKRKPWASNYDQLPIGCFIDTPTDDGLQHDGCVYYNEGKDPANLPANGPPKADPANPVGTPVCITTNKWDLLA